MRAHECIDVQTTEDVSVKDDNGIIGSGLQVRQSVSNRATGAEWLLLRRDHDVDSEVHTFHELREDLGPITRRQDDAFDSRIAGTGDLVHRERDSRDRQHGFGRVHRQRSQAGSLASYEQHGFGHRARVPHSVTVSGRTMKPCPRRPPTSAPLFARAPTPPSPT